MPIQSSNLSRSSSDLSLELNQRNNQASGSLQGRTLRRTQSAPSILPSQPVPPKPVVMGVVEEGNWTPERLTPPLSSYDTIVIPAGALAQPGLMTWREMLAAAHSVHGDVHYFSDDQILHTYAFVARKAIGTRDGHAVYAYKTERGQWVIQQQAYRGCAAGVAAMLRADADLNLNFEELSTTNLASDERMRAMLGHEAKGRYVVTEECGPDAGKALRLLRQSIRKYGAAIAQLDFPGSGTHVMVVDAVEPGGVTLRDPTHMWQIRVKRQTFLDVWNVPSRRIWHLPTAAQLKNAQMPAYLATSYLVI